MVWASKWDSQAALGRGQEGMDAKGAYKIRGLMQELFFLFHGCQFIKSMMLDIANILDLHEGPGKSCLLKTALLFPLDFLHVISIVTWLDN